MISGERAGGDRAADGTAEEEEHHLRPDRHQDDDERPATNVWWTALSNQVLFEGF